MYSSLLKIAGVALIISSFISLILLLKRNVKQCIICPFYVFAISDVLSTSIIAIMLLMNSHNDIQVDQDDYHDEDEHGVEMAGKNCNSQSVLMHHAMFLVPLTNTFMSLLSKLLLCHDHIQSLEKKYSHFVNIETSTVQEESRKSRYTLPILSVASQWIVPGTLVAILSTIGHTKLDILTRSHDITCIFTSNFLLDHCYNMKEPDTTVVFNDTDYLLPVAITDHVHEMETIESFPLNFSSIEATDNIVFKIHNIVQSLLNTSEIVLRETRLEYPRSSVNMHRYMENLTNQVELELPECMKNQCFMSPSILKTHLSFLLFVIYFGSILLSSILYTRVGYIYCRIMERMKIISPIGQRESITNEPLVVLGKNMDASCSSEWFAMESSEERSEGEHPTGKHEDQLDVQKACHENNQFQRIKEDVTKVEKLRFTFRTSFYLAVLMWTPVLLQVLIKVFFCFETSNWFMNTVYLVAVSFGIARNFLNLGVINTKGIMPQTVMNENNQHPTLSTISVEQP